MKDATEGHKRIIFPTFDLSTKRIGLGNGSSEGIMLAYEIKCNPENSTMLKISTS